MLNIIAQIFAALIVATLTGNILLKIRTHALSASPAELTGQEGVISPGKGTAWFTIIGGIIFMLIGLSFITYWGMQGVIPSMLMILMGAAIAGFMVPSLSSIHDVRWNKHYVEGASKMFGPTLGKTRTQIYWPDIVGSGATITGYWYIKSGDGRKIYWSYLYNGHGAFGEAIKRNCPEVKKILW